MNKLTKPHQHEVNKASLSTYANGNSSNVRLVITKISKHWVKYSLWWTINVTFLIKYVSLQNVLQISWEGEKKALRSQLMDKLIINYWYFFLSWWKLPYVHYNGWKTDYAGYYAQIHNRNRGKTTNIKTKICKIAIRCLIISSLVIKPCMRPVTARRGQRSLNPVVVVVVLNCGNTELRLMAFRWFPLH